MSLPRFSSILLLNDDHTEEGVSHGAIGVILDDYEDGDCEVEFSREDGSTIAWFAVRPDEIALANLAEVEPVRRTGD